MLMCTRVCLMDMWRGRAKSPLSTCDCLSASDGTGALVLCMLNALGELKEIEMKKAPS